MVDGLRVLVVDDETGLADLYAALLEDRHHVRTAYDGEEALEKVDENTDIVFLDRRMPGISGDEVLAEIRDRGLGCRVAMVTAVDADFDVLDMPFDAYLTKPVSEADLHEVVERLHRRSSYDAAIQRYFSLASRRATLEAAKSPARLEASDEYAALLADIETLESELDALADRLDDEDAAAFFAEF